MRRIRPPLFDERALEKALAEKRLIHFLRLAWPHFDPSVFTSNWHLEAIAEHLEAVSYGEIRRLLINVPPRHCKTSIVAIAWPVWTWAKQPEDGNPLIGPGVRFLCASYGAKKAQQDGVTARRLIASNWFQERWGDRVQIAKDRDNQEQYDTTAGGWRISTGIPESLGKGGVIRVVDDPHKTDEIESDVVRGGVIRAYDEIWRTRENDPNAGAEVIIMQRQAENDLSGHVLNDGDMVHLCLPAEYDPGRHCTTVVGFSDPRTEDGELLWPARFGPDWAETQKRRVGEFAWAGQYLQSPQPRGGGVIKAEWWQSWSGEDRQKYPPFEYILATVDTATSIKTEADFSACTVWGLWRDEFETPRVIWRDAAGIAHETRQGFRGAPRLMLMYAWQDRLTLHDLVLRLIETASRFKVDRLRIEATAAGFAAHQELHRLLSDGCHCAIDLERVPQGMDKYARLVSVQHLFQEGLIYAPDKAWADMVIEQVSAFPRGAHDDLVDCTSAAVRYMRDINMALRSQEHTEAETALSRHRGRAAIAPLYDA